jgi:signal transduction histidine kinase
MIRLPWSWSIERKLPLFVSALLLAVVLVLLGAAYREVRSAALSFASQRVLRSNKAWVSLFARAVTAQRAQGATLATDQGVRDFVASGGRRGGDWALAAARRVVPDGARNTAVEMWDTAGRRLLLRGDSALTSDPAPLPTSDSAVVGPWRLRHDTLMYYQVGTIVRQGSEGAAIGRVVQVARLNVSAAQREILTGIAGGDIDLMIGNANGDPWTDLEKPIPAPPVAARSHPDSTTATTYQSDEPKIGAALQVPGTPWMFISELSRTRVFAPSQVYLRRMSLIAAAIVLVGALGAWWVSRRITDPLRHLTTAAAAIASGDLAQRVAVPGTDELGRLGGSFNTMADEVQRARSDLEAQVVERTRALRETNAELEAFSYSVSHDLRAPLRAIHGFARILLEDHGPALDPEAKRVLGVIDQNTKRMGQLIDDLLSFSRLGRKELESARVDMAELVRSVADEVQRSAGDRPLEITVGPLPPAQGDRDMLRQAVTNLLDNAAKFTRRRTPGRIDVGHQTNGAETVYFVKDNGAGFDQRYAGKLFGVFQRLHRADEFEGTGVGLAIVQRIVLRHGGRVWAEGQRDAGATFFFTLPGASDA